MLIGVISDTHGLMRQEALDALVGVEHILHAGDIGRPEILAALEAIAPVTAIRGNVDQGLWCASIPETEMIELEGQCIYMLHDRNALPLDPVAAGIGIIISGHSHQPSIEKVNGVLYLNPGSAGPRRFSLPITLALMTIEAGVAQARLVEVG